MVHRVFCANPVRRIELQKRSCHLFAVHDVVQSRPAQSQPFRFVIAQFVRFVAGKTSATRPVFFRWRSQYLSDQNSDVTINAIQIFV